MKDKQYKQCFLFICNCNVTSMQLLQSNSCLCTHTLPFLVVSLFKLLWKPAKTSKPKVRAFTIPPLTKSRVFDDYFDRVQAQLETLASMDDLLSGTYYY